MVEAVLAVFSNGDLLQKICGYAEEAGRPLVVFRLKLVSKIWVRAPLVYPSSAHSYYPLDFSTGD